MTKFSAATTLRPARVLLATLMLALAGGAVFSANAQPRHAGFGAHGFGLLGGHQLNRMLDGVNATDAQRAQIREIMRAARTDLAAQRRAGAALREQALQVFTQPTVDANAVEALRQQQLQQHDQTSRRITQAMLDVSRVLTPEQRVQLGERMKQRKELLQRHLRERRELERSGNK